MCTLKKHYNINQYTLATTGMNASLYMWQDTPSFTLRQQFSILNHRTVFLQTKRGPSLNRGFVTISAATES